MSYLNQDTRVSSESDCTNYNTYFQSLFYTKFLRIWFCEHRACETISVCLILLLFNFRNPNSNFTAFGIEEPAVTAFSHATAYEAHGAMAGPGIAIAAIPFTFPWRLQSFLRNSGRNAGHLAMQHGVMLGLVGTSSRDRNYMCIYNVTHTCDHMCICIHGYSCVKSSSQRCRSKMFELQ